MQPLLCRAFVVPYSSQTPAGYRTLIHTAGKGMQRGSRARGERRGGKQGHGEVGGALWSPLHPAAGLCAVQSPPAPHEGAQQVPGLVLPRAPPGVGWDWHHMGPIKPHAPSLQGCSVGWGLLFYRDRLYSGFLCRVPSIGTALSGIFSCLLIAGPCRGCTL